MHFPAQFSFPEIRFSEETAVFSTRFPSRSPQGLLSETHRPVLASLQAASLHQESLERACTAVLVPLGLQWTTGEGGLLGLFFSTADRGKNTCWWIQWKKMRWIHTTSPASLPPCIPGLSQGSESTIIQPKAPALFHCCFLLDIFGGRCCRWPSQTCWLHVIGGRIGKRHD